jgi:hypothetical protein
MVCWAFAQDSSACGTCHRFFVSTAFRTIQKAWASSFPPTYFYNLLHERHLHAETALLECRYYEGYAEYEPKLEYRRRGLVLNSRMAHADWMREGMYHTHTTRLALKPADDYTL